MELIEEVVRRQEAGHAVKRPVADEDRTEERLFDVKVVRSRANGEMLRVFELSYL
jgi:hypothetical protein